MTFTEFLNQLSAEQVNNWWKKELPIETSEEVAKQAWKYSLVKNGKKYPFKWAIDELANFYNIPIAKNSYSSNLSNRDSFCKKFDFTIEEALVYDSTEAKNLVKLYNKFENTQALFQDFINYAHQIVTDNNIEAYKIRMAIGKAVNEAMIIIGKRNVLCFREVKGKARVGFIVSEKFIDNKTISLNYETFPYTNPDNGTMLLRVDILNWNDISKDLIISNQSFFLVNIIE